jgi:hypothetical protein
VGALYLYAADAKALDQLANKLRAAEVTHLSVSDTHGHCWRSSLSMQLHFTPMHFRLPINYRSLLSM